MPPYEQHSTRSALHIPCSISNNIYTQFLFGTGNPFNYHQHLAETDMKAAISDFFFLLYAKTIVLLIFLLIQLIILIRNLKTHTSPITISQYLQLIEEKSPSVCFSKTTLNILDQQECRVCLCDLQEGDKVRTLKCKHTFHKDCLDKWLLQFWATCPLCRNKVLPEDVVTNYQRLRNQVNYDDNNDDENHPIMSFFFALRGVITLQRFI